VIHLSDTRPLHPARGGCHSVSAVGSGVCREARDGAYVMYKEEAKVRHAGTGKRIDKQEEPEMRIKVKATQVTCIEGTTTGQCKTGKCISIGADNVCTDCGKAGEVPINGKCVAYNNDLVTAAGCTKSSGDLDDQSTTCGKCTGTNYFLHKGGCYAQATPPGQTICQTPGSTAGVCETCSADNGYFKNPDAAATTDSCISCGDATGVTIGSTNTKTYKGVDGCAKCTAPNSILGDTGTAVATCTECNAELYLKTDSTATPTTSCVQKDGCSGGFFPTTDSTANNKKVCVSCSESSKGGIAKCSACELLPSTTRASTVLISCSACSSDNLSPLKNECMTTCPAGTYADSNKVCTPCHTSCSSCSDAGESSCTACYPGSVLSYGSDTTKGTCIKECTGAFMAHCKAGGCTLDVGGSKYCSRCAAGYAPIDGVCTAMSTGARDASGCKANDGKCTACTGANYALLSGGCYNTQALPGSAVCAAANNGQCQTCANGQQPASGVCPACPAGCSKCSGSSGSQICSECLAGYYKSGTSCVKCSENSTNGSNTITGVKDCVSCTAPTSNSGTVTCYVTQTPTVDPTDPSVNKGGLSSGAIAGISIAVIAVVGGLVGFLCWWFVCRGKA
ncbi:Variant-specific surface protein, partial [Giardia duodenalis]